MVSIFSAATTGFKNYGSAIYTPAPVTESSGDAVSITTSATGGPCQDVSGLVNPLGPTHPPNGVPIEYPSSVCRLATFSAAMTAAFGPTAGLDPALETISMAPQPVNGIVR